MFYYLEDYTLKIFPSQDGKGYIATTFEMPAISGFGDTVEDAMKELREAFSLTREVLEEDNEDMPEPLSKKRYSGQFTIRIPRDLHYRLVEAALNQQISVNQLINHLLSKSVGELCA